MIVRNLHNILKQHEFTTILPIAILFCQVFGSGHSIPFGFCLAQNFHGNIKHGMHYVIKLFTRDGSTDSNFVNASCKKEKLSFLSSFATFGSLFFVFISLLPCQKNLKKKGGLQPCG
jgi:hypothetical protein